MQCTSSLVVATHAGGKVGKQFFNIRLAPEDVNDALSGYEHNAGMFGGMLEEDVEKIVHLQSHAQCPARHCTRTCSVTDVYTVVVFRMPGVYAPSVTTYLLLQ